MKTIIPFRRSGTVLPAAVSFLLIAGLWASGQTAAASGQAPASAAPADAPAIKFSVVSVKENRSDDLRNSYSIPRNGDSISYTNYPLFYMVIFSNDFHRSDLVFGLPDWTKNTRYDIVAKVAAEDVEKYRALPGKERLAMFQQVLADRFKLQFHRETRELPDVEMTVAKGGPKLKAPDPNTPLDLTKKYGEPILRVAPGDIEAEGGTMADLAAILSTITQGKQIVDKTGLAGKYDFSFKYSPEMESAPLQAQSGTLSTPSDAPSLPTALREQLGLELKSGKGPFDCFVVDHIERPTPD